MQHSMPMICIFLKYIILNNEVQFYQISNYIFEIFKHLYFFIFFTPLNQTNTTHSLLFFSFSLDV